jgi:hypothetical protein
VTYMIELQASYACRRKDLIPKAPSCARVLKSLSCKFSFPSSALIYVLLIFPSFLFFVFPAKAGNYNCNKAYDSQSVNFTYTEDIDSPLKSCFQTYSLPSPCLHVALSLSHSFTQSAKSLLDATKTNLYQISNQNYICRIINPRYLAPNSRFISLYLNNNIIHIGKENPSSRMQILLGSDHFIIRI